jgi:hypothetical protein
MDVREGRQAAMVMLAGTAGSVLLMLHHPTSLKGPDDGLLLGDWSNATVHGGMILCLLAITLGVGSVPRRLDERHLSVRAGRLGFNAGMAAFVAAALINGFATGRPETELSVLFALNQTLAVFGLAMAAGGMALWAARMLRAGLAAKLAGGVGLGAAVLASGWRLHGGGAFGLIPAVVATGVFAAWSVLVAIDLMRVEPGAEA